GRMLDLLDDARLPERGVPVHLADAHREGDDHRLLILLRLRIVIEPMLRDVDHDTVAGPRRKNALSGQQDVLPLPWDPQIGPGVGADDLLVAEAVAPRYVQQGVLIRRLDVLVRADHGATVCGQLVDGRPGRRPRQHSAHDEAGRPDAHIHSGNNGYVIDSKDFKSLFKWRLETHGPL